MAPWDAARQSASRPQKAWRACPAGLRPRQPGHQGGGGGGPGATGVSCGQAQARRGGGGAAAGRHAGRQAGAVPERHTCEAPSCEASGSRRPVLGSMAMPCPRKRLGDAHSPAAARCASAQASTSAGRGAGRAGTNTSERARARRPPGRGALCSRSITGTLRAPGALPKGCRLSTARVPTLRGATGTGVRHKPAGRSSWAAGQSRLPRSRRRALPPRPALLAAGCAPELPAGEDGRPRRDVSGVSVVGRCIGDGQHPILPHAAIELGLLSRGSARRRACGRAGSRRFGDRHIQLLQAPGLAGGGHICRPG